MLIISAATDKLGQLLMSATTVLTVFSGGNYLLKNADLLKG